MQLRNEPAIEGLLHRIASGDTVALGQLMDHYNPLLEPYINGFTKSKERTEEILQDIFFQVWQMRETLSTIHNFQVFLYVMAKNQALNAVRATMREYQRREKYVAMQPDDDATGHTEALDLIEAAVNHLPPQQQRVWKLSRYEGKKYAVIAAEMGLSETSVKKYVRLANAAITTYVLERQEALLLAAIFTLPIANNFF